MSSATLFGMRLRLHSGISLALFLTGIIAHALSCFFVVAVAAKY